MKNPDGIGSIGCQQNPPPLTFSEYESNGKHLVHFIIAQRDETVEEAILRVNERIRESGWTVKAQSSLWLGTYVAHLKWQNKERKNFILVSGKNNGGFITGYSMSNYSKTMYCSATERLNNGYRIATVLVRAE